MTYCASRPCSYLCLESQDGCVPFEDKGFAVINRKGHDDSWSTGQSNCIWDKVSQGHVEMEGQPPEMSLTKWKWPRRLSLTDTRWVWWRRDILCPSWRVADLGWIIECYHNLKWTPSIHSNCPPQNRSSSEKISITVSLRDREKDCPEPFPVESSLKKCLPNTPNNLQVYLIWHLSHHLQLGIMRSNWPSAGAILCSWSAATLLSSCSERPHTTIGHTRMAWHIITIKILPKTRNIEDISISS